MKPFTYLIVNFLCIIIPFSFSFYKKHPFSQQWKALFVANITVGLPFIIWDIIFTKIGVWGFNETYLSGVYIFNLPLEEVLFFFCIPYSCVFTFFAFEYFFSFKRIVLRNVFIYAVFVALSILFVILGYDQLYTFCTGLFLLIFMIYTWWKKYNIYPVFISYLAIIPFFLVSNGVLTGSGLEEPIVWYNNHENFGKRIGTIPIEDFFYGFLLISMNIYTFQFLRKKWGLG